MTARYTMRERITLPAGDISDIEIDSNDSGEDVEVSTKFIRSSTKSCNRSPSTSEASTSESSNNSFNDATTSKSIRRVENKKVAKGKLQKSARIVETWSDGDLPSIESSFKFNVPTYESFETSDNLPIDYFKRFLMDDIILHMATATNEYSISKKGSSIEVIIIK